MKNAGNKLSLKIFSALLAIAGCLLLCIEIDSIDFWETEYIAFLSAILVAPLFYAFKPVQGIRIVVLLLCLALFGFLQWSCPRPTGAIELLIVGLKNDHPVLIHIVKLSVILFGTIVFSRFFCSMICPKGTIQELLFRDKLALKVPHKLDGYLKYIKYVMLVALVLSPLVFEFRLFRTIGPFKVLFNLDGSWFLIGFLALVIIASLFIGRPFCRYICPVGALLAIIARFSPFRIRVDDKCNGCGKCEKICPVDAIYLQQKKTAITLSESECIACRQCESVCSQNAIYFGAKRNTDNNIIDEV